MSKIVTPKRLVSTFTWQQIALLFTAVLSIPTLILSFFIENPIQLISEYGQFFFLGLAGAIVANSTGAGGGIVFIPAFTSMGVAGVSALGTSLAIQCFGMTAGSLSWLHSMYSQRLDGKGTFQLVYPLLILTSISSVFGMLSAQYFFSSPTWPVEKIFKYFSIIFGLVLLSAVLRRNKNRQMHNRLRRRDIPIIAVVCFLGGVITSWISIGVGEWLALLLFFLGYPTMVVVCVAVCISSIVVLSGIPYHIWVVDSITWQILLFAAPAAVIGGSVARLLSERLGPVKLKIFFSIWVLATGFFM